MIATMGWAPELCKNVIITFHLSGLRKPAAAQTFVIEHHITTNSHPLLSSVARL